MFYVELNIKHDSVEMPRHSIPALYPAEAYPTVQEDSLDRDYP